MSDLGNQMGQMMRAGMQNEKAKHENERPVENYKTPTMTPLTWQTP